jgi:hypothetical protein
MAAMIRRVAALVLLLAASCGTSQSEECKQYIDCRRAYDEEAGNTRADLAAYEFDGDCWVDGSTASDCTDACKEQLAETRTAVEDNELDVPACD